MSATKRAWTGLVAGAALSILGNVTHTVLATSTVGLAIRVPLAVVWPLALFVAVEIFVRTPWTTTALGWIGRIILLGPVSAVAAVVSYQHIHALMNIGGEDRFSATVGPVAIDGLMLGSTVALLVMRLIADPEPLPEPAEITIDAPATDLTLVKALSLADVPIADRAEYDEATAAVGNARVPRIVRALSDADKKAIEALIDGTPSVDAVAAMNGKSLPTIRKWRQAVTSGRPVKGVSPAVLNYALEVMAR